MLDECRLNQYIVEIVDHLLDEGLAVEEYTGYSKADRNIPFNILFGDSHVADVEFIMNEKSNGDYDGLDGFNVSLIFEED